MAREAHRLVFIDESGVTTKMTRLQGRSLRGQRLKADAPYGHWRTQTFIAGLRLSGLVAPWVLDGPMNRLAFEAYIETQLAPTLSPGDVVIMDNLASHKSLKAAECLGSAGRLAAVSPTLQSRPEPHRNGFLKAESPSSKRCPQNNRRPLESHRQYL